MYGTHIQYGDSELLSVVVSLSFLSDQPLPKSTVLLKEMQNVSAAKVLHECKLP